MLWGAIKQSSQSIARFKLCSGSYRPPHPMQMFCPKTNFLTKWQVFTILHSKHVLIVCWWTCYKDHDSISHYTTIICKC
jgi:hypothetical protein